MRKAIKQAGCTVCAYQLGTASDMERKLIDEGKIVVRSDGCYEIFSQEAVNGQGEIAAAGDYFKLDGNGFPYPNSRTWFEAHHRKIHGNLYEQLNQPLSIWQADDPLCPEIEFLLRTGKLTIVSDDEEHYFSAFLWGAPLSAAKDATIVFYSIEYIESGAVADISFNFVAKKEFERDYLIVQDF